MYKLPDFLAIADCYTELLLEILNIVVHYTDIYVKGFLFCSVTIHVFSPPLDNSLHDESFQTVPSRIRGNSNHQQNHPYAASVPISMPTWKREKHSFEDEEEEIEEDKKVGYEHVACGYWF